jgi:glycopeptide antibiotics resistance protein
LTYLEDSGEKEMQRSVWWLIVAVVLLLITWLSSIPHLAFFTDTMISPAMKRFIAAHTYQWGTNGFFSYAIYPHPDFILHKIGHITLFGSLGVALYFATAGSVRLSLLLSVLCALADEMHQYWVPGRSSRFGDVLLDILAALFFMLLVRMYARSCSRKSSKEDIGDSSN